MHVNFISYHINSIDNIVAYKCQMARPINMNPPMIGNAIAIARLTWKKHHHLKRGKGKKTKMLVPSSPWNIYILDELICVIIINLEHKTKQHLY